MARLPYPDEEPTALLKAFHQARADQSPNKLIYVYNTATAPDVYRSDDEHAECKRIAFLCRRQRANRHGSRSIQETPDGVWFCPVLSYNRR
jgi:hypothetical protein